ncbi:AAA family ATPase [Ferruginibacter sp.]
MSFEPNKILNQHIIEAAYNIERDKIKLNPSIGYDVIINDKKYPPKEIVRIAYRLATGQDAGVIYGGDQVNSILKNLGFVVVEKASVWKLGCNWGKGAPSFYEFIKNEKIVLGTTEYVYKIGDLIIITEGFRVYAIAKITEEFKSVTSVEHYEEFFNYYQIEYEEWVTFAHAEWYELSETESFIYELQQGIRRVQKRDIKEKVFNLWENRYSSISSLHFYTKPHNESPKQLWIYPCLVLSKNSWDDYGYKTSFDLFHYKDATNRIEIGQVKILHAIEKSTSVESDFDKLDSAYCSLGTTLEYYKRLKSEFPNNYKQVLRALNDAAFFDSVRKEFVKNDGFQTSLLRSTESQLALNDAKKWLEEPIMSSKFKFSFEYQVDGALDSHKIDFEFNYNSAISNNLFCIVGKNGTGKTKIISQLANKLTDNNEAGIFMPDRPLFSKIIAISFSYFDKFKIPERQDTSYEFIGVKSKSEILSDTEISNLLWSSFKKITEDKARSNLWLNSIKSSLENEYLDFSLDEIVSVGTKKEFLEKTSDIFSSGQKIVFHFITRLIAVIDKKSLLVFDEPETHLHPNIAGRLLRTLNSILEDMNSFCILSTHSSVIVQEIPSEFIRIFDRQNNFPLVYSPSIETFGENLSLISNAIFKTDEQTELYKSVFQNLVTRYSEKEINDIFQGKLSLNAKLYLQTLLSNPDD